MTTEELAKLTPEEKRIKIAELCGWTPVEDIMGWPPDPKYDRTIWGDGMKILPDYLNDLNDMHEAEKVIHSGHRAIYAEHLDAMLHPEPYMNATYAVWVGAHATAAQRADAFLLTLG